MVMSRDQNAGRSHNLKTDDSFCERVEQFKYLGTVLMIWVPSHPRYQPAEVLVDNTWSWMDSYVLL